MSIIANGTGFPFPLILLTDRRQARLPLLDVIAGAVDGGARFVVLRERDLPSTERADLAKRIQALLEPVDGRLLFAGVFPGPQGRHLAAKDPWPRYTGGLVGRGCHTVAEVENAASHGSDYATLSPIFSTSSKPEHGPPLGPEVFATAARIPVYALGGVRTADQVRRCVRAGATGVATMGAIMRAEDPAGVTAELLTAALP